MKAAVQTLPEYFNGVHPALLIQDNPLECRMSLRQENNPLSFCNSFSLRRNQEAQDHSSAPAMDGISSG
jgi:hypothetical protein